MGRFAFIKAWQRKGLEKSAVHDLVHARRYTYTVRRMRAVLAFISALAVVGCATEQREQPHAYSPPVVVTLKSLQHTNDYSVAVFTMKNVSSNPMWFDGEEREHPACCMEYKSM